MNPSATETYPVKYVLVWSEPGEGGNKIVVLPSVNSISTTADPATRVRFPINGDAYVEGNEPRREQVVISAFTGREVRYGSSASGEPTWLSGPELFEELRKFLDAYSAALKVHSGVFTRSDKKPTLAFYAVWENIAWQVVDYRLDWRHTTRDGFLAYAWTLRLETDRRLDGSERPTPQALKDLGDVRPRYTNTADRREVLYEDGQWILQKTSEQATAAASGLPIKGGVESVLTHPDSAGLDHDLDRALVQLTQSSDQKFMSWCQGAIDDAKRSIARLRRLRLQGQSMVLWPGAAFSDLSRTLDSLSREIDAAIFDLEDPHGAGAKALLELESGVLIAKRALYRTHDRYKKTIVADNTVGPGGVATSDRYAVVGGQACVSRAVNANESLPAFAGRVLGARDLWRTIAALNRQRLTGGMPVGTGVMVLLVPAVGGALQPRNGSSDLYGTCWRVDDQSQLIWRDGGFVQARGSSAWVQAIALRCRHIKGTLASAPDCGLVDIIGDGSSGTDLAIYAFDLRNQVLSDTRTSNVDRLAVRRDGDRIYLDASITPIDGRRRELSVPVVIEGGP